MDEIFTQKADVINIFDRAYLDYEKFDPCFENRVSFVTRLKGNATVEIKFEVDEKGERAIKRFQS